MQHYLAATRKSNGSLIVKRQRPLSQYQLTDGDRYQDLFGIHAKTMADAVGIAQRVMRTKKSKDLRERLLKRKGGKDNE